MLDLFINANLGDIYFQKMNRNTVTISSGSDTEIYTPLKESQGSNKKHQMSKVTFMIHWVGGSLVLRSSHTTH